jgi:hypothetical protein
MIAQIASKFFDITLGNVITWVVTVFGVGAAWGVIKISQSNMEKRLKKLEDFIDHLQLAQVAAAEARAAKLEEKLDRLRTIRQIP